METRRNLTARLTISVFLVAMACGIASGGTIYVDADSAAGGNGTSWANAYKYLKDVLAVSGDDIWVAEGTYKPDTDSANPTGTGSRTATFQLISGVALYGGFTGGESSLDDRDWQTNQTVLSGDLGTVGDNLDNCYQVVTGSGCDETAVLDGFTITGGNADGSGPYAFGGGMYNDGGSPTVTNCTFSDNSAGTGYYGDGGGMCNNFSSPTVTNCTFSDNSTPWGGGGMLNYYGSTTVTNCTFTGNSAGDGGGMCNYYGSPTVTNCTFSDNSAIWGGGMYNEDSSSLMVTNCTFTGNSASADGGGMYNYGFGPTVVNCTFAENSASVLSGGGGGGMYNEISSPTVTNCTFTGNSVRYGGGMYNFYNCSPTVTNCTFTGNSAEEDGGGMWNASSSPTVTNCILRANLGGSIGNIDSSPAVTYSCVQGGYSGVGNIDGDPLFEGGTLRLSAGSPCIDAGDNDALPNDLTDLDGDGDTTEPIPLDLDSDPRIFNSIVDMGAYESQVSPVAHVDIDIYPNRTPNRVFLSRNYTLYVAVLGSADFDVTTLNSSTVKFGKTGTEASPMRAPMIRDLNGDGRPDAMYGFRTFGCDFGDGDTQGWLKGSTASGTPVEGSDSVLVLP